MVAARGRLTSSVTPSTAPIKQVGTISFSSDLSASRENRVPSASAAETSSSTDSGNTKSRGKNCDNRGTVKSAAPKAVMPKIT